MQKGFIAASELEPGFSGEIAAIPGGENIRKCYACGSCTISCPVHEIDPDYNPRKIIRQALLGMRKEVLSSELIWLCANCYTCFERCPQDVRFTSIVHAIKNIAVKEMRAGKIKIKAPSFYFADSFLRSVFLHGRLWEPELVFRLLLKLRDIKKALVFLPLGIEMFKKGKLSLMPSRVKGRKAVKKIFIKARGKR